MQPAHSKLDGDGWLRCTAGHPHWGLHGAAGLLVRSQSEQGVRLVLLQHRAPWTHHGDTWGLPGGAKASWETPEQAALRETDEEVTIPLDHLQIDYVFADDHGGWTYWTVVCSLPSPLSATPRNHESLRLEWVPAADVSELALHPGFAATWPTLSAL